MLVSIPLDGLGISPDGRKLYTINGVIDTKTKSIIDAAPTGVPTPDGRYLIQSNINPNFLKIIDAHSNQIVYTTKNFGMRISGTGRVFDDQRSLLYGVIKITNDADSLITKIGVFDYKKFLLERIINPSQIDAEFGMSGVGDLVVTNDGRKLYSIAFFYGFMGIDLFINKFLTEEYVNYTCFLGITPDDKYIYITDPASYKYPFLVPSGLVRVYSPVSEHFETSINIKQNGLSVTDQIAITPDGRKAYLSTWDGPEVVVINTESNTIQKIMKVGYFINSLVIQKN